MLLKSKSICALTLISLFMSYTVRLSRYAVAAQNKDSGEKTKQGKKEKEGKNTKDDGSAPIARPMLWEDPTDIESRDLFNGPGALKGRPTQTANSPSSRARQRAHPRKSTLKTTRAGSGRSSSAPRPNPKPPQRELSGPPDITLTRITSSSERTSSAAAASTCGT